MTWAHNHEEQTLCLDRVRPHYAYTLLKQNGGVILQILYDDMLRIGYRRWGNITLY